jgi:hypothetical protein
MQTLRRNTYKKSESKKETENKTDVETSGIYSFRKYETQAKHYLDCKQILSLNVYSPLLINVYMNLKKS